MTNYIREYWKKIQSGRIAACRRTVQQYKKLISELDSPRDPWVFDLYAANAPIDFIEAFCRHSKGKWIGKPVRLELFQKAKLQAVYGFIHKDTGLRRCREVFTCVGRKNGKSTEMAALGTYMLAGDGEGGSECFSVATKKDQARIVFSEAVNMVSQSPALSKHVKKRKTDLYFPVTFSKYEPLASDSNSLDGLNSHFVIMDELHAIKNRDLYDVMKQSMSAREQPLLSMITTAGFVRECIFDDIYDYACKVLDGVIEDDRFLAFIYELDSRAEWTDFRCWEKANPGLGAIKSYDELAANVERAKNDPNFLPTVLTKDFNIRETVAGAWLTFEEANNEETFDLEELRDCYGIGGVDLSATTDLTAAVVLVKKPGGDTIYAVCQGFMPGETIGARSVEDKVPYVQWRDRGLITACPGHKVDYRYVTDWFIKLRDEYGILAYWCGYDSWNSPSWTEDMENRLGYKLKLNLLPVIMGPKTLSAPMKLLKADLAAKLINYNNNPVLKWCLTNTSVEPDKNENIRPIKNNQRQRIDLAVALLIAYTVYQNNHADYLALTGE
ncbi:terminase large subunit [Pelotomaculum propionicicum]|uniref:terminase large subunit n=1 Tax=Pelotomaculum propionicicum TaxID=258475 RepID=UPI003B7A1F8F